MKFMKFIITSFLLTLFALVISNFNVQASSDYIGWDYPIKPGTDEWASYRTRAEKDELLQIPNEILKIMSTDELIEVVLKYPYLTNPIFYNDIDTGLSAVTNGFNGLQELITRDDVDEKLMNFYYNSNSPESSYRRVESQLNDSEKSFYSDNIIILMKILINNNDLNRGKSIDFNEIIDELTDTSVFFKLQKRNNNVSTHATSYVYTPNGTSVLVYNDPDTLSASEKQELADYVTLRYPNSSILSPASSAYNCHSYAWYSSSSSNPYWMNNPIAYMSDGSYKNASSLSFKKVYWPTGNHSAIPDYNTSWWGTGVISKWGQGPLVSHSYLDSPYEGSQTFWN